MSLLNYVVRYTDALFISGLITCKSIIMKPLPPNYKIEPVDQMNAHYESTFLSRADITRVLVEPGDILWKLVSTIHGRRFSDWLGGKR